MKKIYVMRHAKAVHNSKIDDHERPLQDVGIESCRQLARLLEKDALIPDHVICSPSVRTRQTLGVLAETVYATIPVTFLPSLYQASSNEILYDVTRLPSTLSSVLIIGHNPGLHNFCLMLAGRGDERYFESLRDNFPPASFVSLMCDVPEWKNIAPKSGMLELVYNPKNGD